MIRFTLTAVAALAFAAPAEAHIGHVAEVAGHAHWIGLAAAAGAAALAGWLAAQGGEKAEDGEKAEEGETS